MLLIGMTGSIGMGKSTTAAMFAKRGVYHYDADAAVHELYAKGGAAVEPIGQAFPDAIVGGSVDRARLSEILKADPDKFKQLEAIVHPLAGASQHAALVEAERAGHTMALLDIPLLLETGGDARVDVVVVVTCDPEIQRTRVLERPGMTAEKFEMIKARQMPDAEKRARANFLVDTGNGIQAAEDQVDQIIQALSDWPERAWDKRTG